MSPASRFYLIIWIVICLSVSRSMDPAVAQSSSVAEQEEIQAVFRISKTFLGHVTNRPIVADIPLCANVLKFRCNGVIHGEGKLAIALQRSGQQAAFEVTGEGHGYACVRGVRGPLIAYGRAWGPFSSRTLVQFDGRRFTHLETTPNATVFANVQRVTGHRDRRIGRLIGAGILPLADKMVPEAVAQATPIADRYLKNFVEETADKIISKLNQTTPVEESVNRLFPKTKDWVFQMSSDEEFLQAAYGPPEVAVPTLPQVTARFEDVRLEAWLRSTSEEARLLAEMSKRPLAQQLVQRYLESTLPELAAVAEQRSVDAVDSWVVIRIGAPKE